MNMHRHKILAQILLILTILNSGLAAPIVRIREIPKSRGAVAVRVPADSEGVVSVLVKRPFFGWDTFGWGKSAPAGPSPEHQSEEAVHNAQSTMPQHETPETEEVYYDASSEELKPPQSNAAWRQKIITPEKIKATKSVAAAGLLTAAYLGLLLPEIIHDSGQDSQS